MAENACLLRCEWNSVRASLRSALRCHCCRARRAFGSLGQWRFELFGGLDCRRYLRWAARLGLSGCTAARRPAQRGALGLAPSELLEQIARPDFTRHNGGRPRLGPPFRARPIPPTKAPEHAAVRGWRAAVEGKVVIQPKKQVERKLQPLARRDGGGRFAIGEGGCPPCGHRLAPRHPEIVV
eukprot:scaffold236625_cov27-Tisochrysis_lutea.AAC.1